MELRNDESSSASRIRNGCGSESREPSARYASTVDALAPRRVPPSAVVIVSLICSRPPAQV
jgi:hypothetical protein